MVGDGRRTAPGLFGKVFQSNAQVRVMHMHSVHFYKVKGDASVCAGCAPCTAPPRSRAAGGAAAACDGGGSAAHTSLGIPEQAGASAKRSRADCSMEEDVQGRETVPSAQEPSGAGARGRGRPPSSSRSGAASDKRPRLAEAKLLAGGAGAMAAAREQADREVKEGRQRREMAILNRTQLKPAELINKISGRLRNTYFVKPVPATEAPDYYAKHNPCKTSWNTDVVCFDMMLEKDRSDNNYRTRAKQLYGSGRPDMCLSLVEKDLNLIVYNAIIYNNQNHAVNTAARKLSEVIQAVVREFESDYRFCSVCGGDELYVENPISICDWCCAGVHKNCSDKKSSDRVAQHCTHPLRGDDAWFCGDACRDKFQELARNFKLPVDKKASLSATVNTDQVVLARQNKDEEMCFGVTIKPQSFEQIKAAADSPKKVLVLWPVPGDNGMTISVWGMSPRGQIKDATDDVVARHFQTLQSLKDKELAKKHLQWCRDYVNSQEAEADPVESDGGAPSVGAGEVANWPPSAVSGVPHSPPHAHGAPHGAPPKPPSRISHSSASCPAASSSKPLPPQPVQQPRSAPGGQWARQANGETRAGEGAGHSAAPVAETAVATKLPAKAPTKDTVDKAPPAGQEQKREKEKEKRKEKETKRERETEFSVVASEKRDRGCEKRARGAAAEETHQAKIKVEGQELEPTPTATIQKAAPGGALARASESLQQHCVTHGPRSVSSETSESSLPTPEMASNPGVEVAGPISSGTHAVLGADTSPPPPPPPPPPASSSCLPVNHSDAAATLSGDGASRKAMPGDHQSAAETLAALASLTKQREAGNAAKHSSSQGGKSCASSRASKASKDVPAPAALSKVAVGVKQLPKDVASPGISSQVAGSDASRAAPGGAESEHGGTLVKAKEMVTKAYYIFLKVLGPDHPNTQALKPLVDE